ncbi:MAG TPA: hypothetical protein VLC28_10435, partial [Flavitalea sp.]|nr:hypothetical protein [Flavitalea sp.]
NAYQKSALNYNPLGYSSVVGVPLNLAFKALSLHRETPTTARGRFHLVTQFPRTWLFLAVVGVSRAISATCATGCSEHQQLMPIGNPR